MATHTEIENTNGEGHTSTPHALMEIIDEHKTEMPDNVYKQLAEKLGEQYKAETTKLYLFKVICPVVRVEEEGRIAMTVFLRQDKIVVQTDVLPQVGQRLVFQYGPRANLFWGDSHQHSAVVVCGFVPAKNENDGGTDVDINIQGVAFVSAEKTLRRK